MQAQAFRYMCLTLSTRNTGSFENLSRPTGNWDPATFRSTCFPDVPSSSLGAVVGAATSTVDPDVTPEDRALQVRHHRPAAQPVLQTWWMRIGMSARCLQSVMNSGAAAQRLCCCIAVYSEPLPTAAGSGV